MFRFNETLSNITLQNTQNQYNTTRTYTLKQHHDRVSYIVRCTHTYIYISDLRRYIYDHICFIDKWVMAKSLYLADYVKLEEDREMILPQHWHKNKM